MINDHYKLLTVFCDNIRLDKFLADSFNYSRKQIQLAIKSGCVVKIFTDDSQQSIAIKKPSFVLQAKDQLKVDVKKLQGLINTVSNEDIKKWLPAKLDCLDIIYEDSEVLVINKPKNMVCHPGSGTKQITLIQGVMHYLGYNPNDHDILPARFGLMHRLDKDTSGCLLIAKTIKSYENLFDQWQRKLLSRKYLALLDGQLPHPKISYQSYLYRSKTDRKTFKSITLENFFAKYNKNNNLDKKLNTQPIYDNYSVKDDELESLVEIENTKYRLCKSIFERKYNFLNRYDLCEVNLLTGRTHQIRVHALCLNAGVIGDQFYKLSKKSQDTIRHLTTFKINQELLDSQLLHSRQIEFNHPKKNQKITVCAPLDKKFATVIKRLKDINL